MKREKHTNRFSLTILFSLIVFFILLISLVLAAAIVMLTSWLGWADTSADSFLHMLPLFLLMVIVSLVIGFGVALVASRIPLQPINLIITQMNHLANGNFRARLEFGKTIASHPTFREVSESFNKMAEELENTEMLRTDFINNFSHEFKTPIVSISGFAKLLKRDHLTDEQKAEYINIIEEESLRLAAMANNVLNLTSVENQTILTNVSSFNLSEQIRSSVLLLENRWTGKNITFSLEFGEYIVSANEELLKQVWINLIDNAIKFSPENGEVEINVAEQGAKFAVSITNSGTPISADNQKKIFNKFYQADESHSGEGNGVGLAIVKRIAELHRGTVFVQSGDEMTTFTVEIPKIQEGTNE